VYCKSHPGRSWLVDLPLIVLPLVRFQLPGLKEAGLLLGRDSVHHSTTPGHD
jgi:hypothetical protein